MPPAHILQVVRRVMGAASRAHLGYVGVLDTLDDAGWILAALGGSGLLEVHPRREGFDPRWAWYAWTEGDHAAPSRALYPWPVAALYARGHLHSFAATLDGEGITRDREGIVAAIHEGIPIALTVPGA